MMQILKLIVASAISPGLPPAVAYFIALSLHITIPDHWDITAFIQEGKLFYIVLLPGFLTIYNLCDSRWQYILFGMFATWPIWNFLMMFPSDASVNPLNPQFFLAPSTTILGLASGLIFFTLTRRNDK